MQVRNIILGALSALTVLAFFKLLLDSQGDAGASIGEDELEQAISQFERDQRSGDQSRSAPTPKVPRRTSKARTSTAKSSPEPEDKEPYTAPAPKDEEEVFNEQMDIKTQMNAANRFYDKADYESARDAALEILNTQANNVRMLRIVVSSSCIMAEEEVATKYFSRLPARDQRQMARRCQRYGIEFPEDQ